MTSDFGERFPKQELAHALPGELGNDGVVSGFDGAGAEGEGVSLKAVVADFGTADPQGKEAGFDVMGDGVAFDGEASGVGDVAAVAARAGGGGDALDDSLAVAGRAEVAAHVSLGGVEQVATDVGAPRLLDDAVVVHKGIVDEAPGSDEVGGCGLGQRASGGSLFRIAHTLGRTSMSSSRNWRRILSSEAFISSMVPKKWAFA